jgi:hypothetical protein
MLFHVSGFLVDILVVTTHHPAWIPNNSKQSIDEILLKHKHNFGAKVTFFRRWEYAVARHQPYRFVRAASPGTLLRNPPTVFGTILGTNQGLAV